MEFRVLGPLEAVAEGGLLPLGGSRQRGVLALLLLHANEVVATERLVDELWGERAPPTAVKIVQNAVVGLRKVLGERVVTQIRGYMLRVEPDELDRDRFERLAGEARLARERGERERALELFLEGLRLWRGPAFADFVYEPFARNEIARLDELRLVCLEERLEVELELGRHLAVVGDLENLVAEQPLREGFRGQLMLALYRAGRQADALRVYRDTRRVLVEELGIEPGPSLRELERAILAQDPALEPARPLEPTTRPRGLRRKRLAAVAVAAGVAVAAALVGLLITGGKGSISVVPPNSVAAIDPAANRVVTSIPVGARPAYIAAGSGAVWVANLDDGSVSRLDPTRRRVTRTIPVGDPATGLAAGSGSVWVATQAGAVRRIDPAFDTVVQTIHARSYRSYGFEIDPTLDSSSPIAVGDGSVWFGHSSFVSRIDPRAGVGIGFVGVGLSPAGIAVGNGVVWVADSVDDNVTRISPSGVTMTIPVGHGASAIAIGAGGVWVVETPDNSVVEIDPGTGAVRATIPVGQAPTGIAVGAGAVWVANSHSGSVSRIDPASRTVVRTIAIGGSPSGVVVADGTVWVSVQAQAVEPTGVVKGGTARINAPADLDAIDPAFASDSAALQLEYATCLKLLNYPDAPPPGGEQLRPRPPRRCRPSRTAAEPTRSGSGAAFGSRPLRASWSRPRRSGTRSSGRSS